MSRSYLETFFRHRLLLTIPILVAFVLGAALALKQPREYLVGASVWADSQVPEESTVGTTGGDSPPSAGQQSLLGQLLATRTFMRGVVTTSPLADEYAAADPLTADRMLSSVAARFTMQTPGPQLLSIGYTSNDPEEAKGVMGALLEQYDQALIDEQVSRAKQQLRYDREQLRVAAQAVRNQPGRAAAQSYEEAIVAVQSSRALVAESRASGLRIVDTSDIAYPQARRKTLLLGAVGGLLAGLTISLIGLVVLMYRDRSLRSEAEAFDALGFEIAGSVPSVKGTERSNSAASN